MPTSTLMRTAALRAAGGFDASYAPAADIALYFKMLGESDMAWTKRPLSYLRIHAAHTHSWGDGPNPVIFKVWSDAAAGSPWRATLGLTEPSDPLRKAIQLMHDMVSNTAASSDHLDAARYAQLAAPSRHDDPATFGEVDEGLFDAIVHNHGAPVGPSMPSASAPVDLIKKAL